MAQIFAIFLKLVSSRKKMNSDILPKPDTKELLSVELAASFCIPATLHWKLLGFGNKCGSREAKKP